VISASVHTRDEGSVEEEEAVLLTAELVAAGGGGDRERLGGLRRLLGSGEMVRSEARETGFSCGVAGGSRFDASTG
jgi:hypothetical protein